MTCREVRAGEIIALRARFRDDLQDPAEASGVYIHLYEPSVDSFVTGNAHTASGAPVYLGEGIFEYQFDVPDNGPDGFWHDQWEGMLTGQQLEAMLSFEVSASGEITQLSSQLYNNNVVTVTIESGVQATDGSALTEPFLFEFMTTTSPSYTNTRKVRLGCGIHIQDVEDDAIQTAILEASLEADVLTFYSNTVNTGLFEHARREYVTCMASSYLLNNLPSLLKSKTLDNLRVEYDTTGVFRSLDKIQECLEKWEPQLISGGGAKARNSIQYTVKGEWDPDRPPIGRMWMSTETGGVSRRVPVANQKVRQAGQRRFQKTRRKKFW